MPGTQGLTIDQLITAVKQLPPTQLHVFTRRLSAWQTKSRKESDEETGLIAAAQVRLPATAERRLRRLARKSEQGLLSAKELEEYRALAQQAEQMNAQRVEAVAKLARRWGKPVSAVMREIGWREGKDAAASRSARRSSVGA